MQFSIHYLVIRGERTVFQNYKISFDILNSDSNLDDLCEPYSQEACIKAAQSIGYEAATKETAGTDFAVNNGEKGTFLIMRSFICSFLVITVF